MRMRQTEGNPKEQPARFADRLSDTVAVFGGSWGFILIFAAAITLWMLVNAGSEGFDPYPYLLLNLGLNVLAAVQAPIIMMSQRRQELRDRERAHHAYRLIHASAEEIARLHEKLDRLELAARLS
jgi:uncharacterized membrane protein